MSNTPSFFCPLTVAILALASVNGVSAVCGTNSIGLANAQAGAIIVDNACGALDNKAVGDFNVCGNYEDGSRVTCRTPFTPSTVRTVDGQDWGNCVTSTERCGDGTVTDQPIIQWCCPAL